MPAWGLQQVGFGLGIESQLNSECTIDCPTQSGLQRSEAGRDSRQLHHCLPHLEELPPVGLAALPVAH